MSLESSIIETQNILNGKQARSGSLVLDNLTVNNPINVSKISASSFTVTNLTVSGTTTTNVLRVNGTSTFGGNVTINNALNVTGTTSLTGSTSIPNISIGPLRDVTINGYLKVGTTITAGGEIRGSKIWNAVWN